MQGTELSALESATRVTVFETDRLRLMHLCESHAQFILELLNEPAFLLHIGDKGVRTEQDARAYMADGPVASYAINGFGLYCVELKSTGEPVGICGLVKREVLEYPDIGYAFLQRCWSQGYALEAAAATMRHAAENLGLCRVLAITTVDNESSIKLLGKLGFRLEAIRPLAEGDRPSKVFSWFDAAVQSRVAAAPPVSCPETARSTPARIVPTTTK